MEPGAIVDNRFVLGREAGAGGMGTVFLASDLSVGAPVALKVLRGRDAIDVERFEREASILAELVHPAIVRYVAHGVTPSGDHYLAMEWLDGVDLAHVLARRPLTLVECVAVMRRAADALACAHARGMVHRDLKPSNLFLPGGDVSRLKVVDFGIARASGEARLTCTGVLLGTPGYVAPEQLQGAAPLDPRSDVFSLGCVFYECLTGRPAFEGAHLMAVLAKILLQGTPSAVVLRPEVPDALDALVQRMMSKIPDRRPRDAAEVTAELDHVAAGEPPLCPPPRSEQRSVPSLPPPRPEQRSSPSLPPPSIRGSAALTLGEQRLVSVVLAGDPESGAATLRSDASAASGLAAAVEPYGGRVELEAGGALIVTIWSNGDPVDRAERAARCALAIFARANGAAIAVVTGRGRVAARLVGGELIDRAVSALRAAPPGTIRLDEATAGALGPRFVVEPDAGGPILRGVVGLSTAPLLLGKASPHVGRDRELGMLEAIFDGCAGEPMAGAALVTGPPGVGKSRLFSELAARLGRREARSLVLVGRGDSVGGAPFGMIADAVRRAAGLRDGEPLAARQRKLSWWVGRRLGGVAAVRAAAFLGEMTGTPSADDRDEALRAARGDPVLMGDSMRAAWEAVLAAECAAHPVLLVLEDLHWGDAATVRLVDSTLRNLADLPLVVLGLARPEVHARFPRLWAERAPHILQLGPLPRRAGEALVREALGDRADDGVVARILGRGGGNPFHLQELVRVVAAGRGDAFPGSVLDAVEARLEAEGGEARRILRAASVLGARFSGAGIAALTGGDERAAREWLAHLAARELIAEASAPALPGDADYVFRHDLVREAAYATLVDDDRTLGHLLAGEWLEQTGHADALALAEHFHRGGQPRRSIKWFLRAAEQALEASDLGAAIDRADKGLACGGAQGQELGGLRLVQAEAHVWRGELALAEARGVEAAALLARGSQAWFRAVGQVVLAAGKLGGFDRVEAWIEPAVALAPHEGAAAARVVCLSWCATYLIFGGRFALADRLVQEIERALVDPLAQGAQVSAIVHQMRSTRALSVGDLGSCLEGLRAAMAAFEQGGDRRNACAMRSNLGFVFAELGDYARAEEALRAAMDAADRMGLIELATAAQHNLGRVVARLGRLPEARALEEAAVEALERQGDPRLSGVGRVYLAEIALLSGDVATAEREARAAVEALQVAGPLRPLAGAVLARALLARGALPEARALAAEAFAELTALGTIEEGESLVRLVHAESLLAADAPGELERAVGSARDRLLARAARIRDAGWRERFLADVPDNARTLALADEVLAAARGR
jgi:serine/threonine protein kinase/tetratricopeptide (TPR) repeat protein